MPRKNRCLLLQRLIVLSECPLAIISLASKATDLTESIGNGTFKPGINGPASVLKCFCPSVFVPEFNIATPRTTGNHITGVEGNRADYNATVFERSQQITSLFAPDFDSRVSRAAGDHIVGIEGNRKNFRRMASERFQQRKICNT